MDEGGNALFDEVYKEGYEEGLLIGRLEVIIDMLMSEDDEILEVLDERIQDGKITEFQRQQALFYIRMGITGDVKKEKGESSLWKVRKFRLTL